MIIRSIALAIFAVVVLSCPCSAADLGDAAHNQQMTRIDWQSPESLPAQFRDHCSNDFWHGRYCSDHCGVGYQFYSCSGQSIGCCKVGLGYCDWHGSLRCAPGL
jgi:hypothetical protein